MNDTLKTEETASTLMISSKKLRVSMDNHLVKWNTGRLIQKELDKLEFFYGYKGIHPDLYEIYTELVSYADGFRNLPDFCNKSYGYDEDTYNAWVEHLDKMLEFQLLVTEKEENSETGEIATRAKEIFGNKDVAEAYCADLHILEQLNMLVDYSESVRNLFNYIVPLIEDKTLLPETEQEIRSILEAKSLGNFEVPEHLLINNQITNPELV